MVTTNQSTTTNNNISFCLTNSDFSPSSSFNFPSKTEKEPLVYNQMNNLRQKRRERFYGYFKFYKIINTNRKIIS